MCLCPGLRLTCCKSGKDRTGMSATLEQVSFLSREFDLADSEYQRALDTMRRSVDAEYIKLGCGPSFQKCIWPKYFFENISGKKVFLEIFLVAIFFFRNIFGKKKLHR